MHREVQMTHAIVLPTATTVSSPVRAPGFESVMMSVGWMVSSGNVQRGSRGSRALWFAQDTGFWHFGPLEKIGSPVGPICAQDHSAVGRPERLANPAAWQVYDGVSWLHALMIRCRAM